MNIRSNKTGLFCLPFLAAALPLQAVTLERIVSREDWKFNCAASGMTVGRDGNVYLNHSPHDAGYILRVSRDGAERRGGDAVYSIGNATANADGTIASANSHFNHSVNLYDRNFNRFTACGEFLVNDQVGWNAPARVEAGASGDFYGIDQHRLRILRITPAGKIVQVFAIPKDAKAQDFRVSEAAQALLLRSGDTLRCLGFDGTVRWTQAVPGGAWTVDEAGLVYLKTGGTNVVKRWSAAGEALPDLLLTGGAQGRGATHLGVFGDDLVIKRANSTELFQVFALTDGTFRHAVQIEHERLAVEVPSLTWTAGETLPLAISFNGPGAPQWRVWLTPLGDTAWRELPLGNGQVTVPNDLAGLYQLRLAPTLNPQAGSEYTVRAVVEVRVPDSQGTVSVWTPLNRVWWGRGEEIPVGVVVRTERGTGVPPVRLELNHGRDARATLWSTNLTLTAGTSVTVRVPAALTAQLADGRYELRAVAPGYTCAAQPLRLGPGMESAPPFRVTQHGDYGNFNSKANAWEFADTAEGMLARARALGVNQYVNRIFAGAYPLTFPDESIGMLRELEKRLAADPAGVAPQKVAFGFPQAHALGAYGAYGLREWLLLLQMDVALPIGTSTYYSKGQSPEQWGAEIVKYTQPLLALPAFQGWNWVANWWVTDYNLRFAAPDEKTAYDAAMKKANETGGWDPVLDTVGDRTIGWQVDAQRSFKESLDKVDAKLRTSSSGPYRRPEVYPPVTFANVDEVDLHFQAEQITTPDWTAHAPDFYKRPGKPAWIHPELWNDIGTGEQILPMSWLAIMRGADGIGTSSWAIPNGGGVPTDPRSAHPGIPSVFRALHTFARQYGPWLTTLENNDRVGIVVSHRQIKVDDWGGIGGRYFTRLWEAYMNYLYARQPATFLFPEDKPDLSRFKALLVVGQRYEIDPPLAALLAQAEKQGITILADATCRESLVKDFTPLGVAFDKIEKLKGFNNDVAWWQFPKALLASAPIVAAKLAAVASPVAEVDQPGVLVGERRNGDARFVWVVNNTASKLDPGLLWRVQNAIATRLPVVANVTLPVKKGEVVYDVFTGSEVSGQESEVRGQESEVSIDADLRYTHARLYAILPQAIEKLALDLPGKLIAGQTFEWTATVPGIEAKLPLHVELRDGTGALIEERFTTTGSGSFTVPINAALPVSLSATELISGKKVMGDRSSVISHPSSVIGHRSSVIGHRSPVIRHRSSLPTVH